MPIAPAEAILRMAVAVVLAVPLGYERERTGHPAGLRTHILVGLASATFMLVSTQFVYQQRYAAGDVVTVDASRIAGSVVTGMGFLAGGVILRTGFDIRGLTTAASLWMVAAIGLSAGGGLFLTAIAGSVAALCVLFLLGRVEGSLSRQLHRQITVVLGRPESRLGAVTQMRSSDVEIVGIDYDRDFDAGTLTLKMDVRVANEAALQKTLDGLEKLSGVRKVMVHRAS